MMINKEKENTCCSKNLFEQFDNWTKIHYYAFKLRQEYPNLFFHYFNYDGIVDDSFSRKEMELILTTLKNFKNCIDGMYGFLSLLVKNKNGITIFKKINTSAFLEHSISVPCIQDAKPTILKEINVIYKI
jgi:hypothetical protein